MLTCWGRSGIPLEKKQFEGDNPELYGTCELNMPVFNSFDTLKGVKKLVFILLEAGEMYLMKTNTNRIRANGNIRTADYLLDFTKRMEKSAA